MSSGNWDAFLTVEGVSGESTREGHEGEIELFSFDFGGSNPSSIGVGSGGGTGTASLRSFNFMKKTDAASAELFQHMCSGKHFPTAKVTLYKAAGGKALDYLTFEFEECYVDNLDWSGSQGGDAIPMESVAMSFGKVTVTYNEQKGDGTKGGAHVGSWDIRKRAP